MTRTTARIFSSVAQMFRKSSLANFNLKAVCFIAALPLMACSVHAQKPVQSSVSSVNSKRTACVSFQGNGVYFSSHVGALIALLENNYEPVFATGGSSGAILASVSRALVENPSLALDGSFAPQMAARLLASSGRVIESVLFLPRFNAPLGLLDSFDVFLSGSSAGVLRADPSDALAHAESIVGQATLVIDFFRTVDFTEVFAQSELSERERVVAALWAQFTNAIQVKQADFADAILLPRTQLVADGRTQLVEIQDRFFKLYRSKNDTFLNNYKAQQESWNTFIEGNAQVFGLNNPERRQQLFKGALEKIRKVQNFDALAATFSGDFLLADPDRVYRAFEGFDSRNGHQIEIPSNVVIHSTARRGKKIQGDWKETTGLDNLYQVYFSNSEQAERVAATLQDPEKNPLQPSNRALSPVVPSERIVATSLALGPTLAATTGEPTAFIRFPINLDEAAKARLGWLAQDERLLGYGGWLEKVSLGISSKFAECAGENVDVYFYTSDGDGVNRFAKMVFLGLLLDTPLRGILARQINGADIDFKAALSGTPSTGNAFMPPSAGTPVFNSIVSSADKVFEETRNMRARHGNVPVNFNYVEPSRQTANPSDALDVVFRSNRRALMLGAYEFARKVAAAQGIFSANLPLWNKPLTNELNVLGQTSENELKSVVDELLPRRDF